MTRPKEFIPRYGNRVSWSKVAENQASPETNATFDGVYLESEEISGLLIIPLRLMELSPYAIADTLFEDVDNSQREYEDRAFWLGTDNWPGIATKMGANNRHTVSGLSNLAGITPTDMLTFAAQLPDLVDRWEGEIEWYCHRSFDMQVFQRFVTTASGATEDDITQRARQQFGGMPINHVNVLPSGRSFNTGTYYAYLGPAKRAAKFGVVRGSQRFAESNQRYIEKRQWCAVASVEIAVNPHEVKNVADKSMMWGLYCTS
jgi:HK97 family phage major capsid protein